MISDKTFSPEEFHSKVKEFAQAFIDKINTPGISLEVKQESPLSYLFSVVKPGRGSEHYQISLNSQFNVETISVYMV